MDNEQLINQSLDAVLNCISKSQNSMQIVVNKKTIDVLQANSIYKQTAKDGYDLLHKSVTDLQPLRLYNAPNQLSIYKRINKDNIYNITTAITQYKSSELSKAELGGVYVESMDNLYTTVNHSKQDLLQEYNDNLQLNRYIS